MPSTTVAYTTSAAEVASADAAWANVTNVQGPPDASSATITLAGLGEASRVILCGPSGYGITLPQGTPRTLSVTVECSASDLTDTLIRAQLYNGTTPLGSLKTTLIDSLTLTGFSLSGDSTYWGVTLTRSVISTLRIGISCVSDTASDVAVDSVGVVVGYNFADGSRSRARLTRSR